jgi:WD40 repeat protein
MILLQRLKTVPDWIEFAPDGKFLLASGSQGTAGTGIWAIPGDRYPRHRIDGATQASFAPDGQLILVAVRDHRNWKTILSRIDSSTYEPASEPVTLDHLGLLELRISPDGNRVVGIHHRSKLVWWGWPDLEPLTAWSGPSRSSCCLAAVEFSPAGESLALLDGYGPVSLHDSRTGEQLWSASMPTVENNGKVTCSPNGKYIAVASGSLLCVLDATSGKVVQHLSQAGKHFLGLAFTRDGRFLATASREETVKFFDTSSWKLQTELAWQVGGLRCIAFSRDGMLAAVGGYGKKVVVWDLDL